MRQLLPAGADDRFDELVVGVLVGAGHQFGQVLTAVGRLVVRTAHIERPDRVVRRADHVDRVEAQARHLEGVTQRGGFSRHVELSEPAPRIHSRYAEHMRRRHRGDGADDDHLCCPGSGHLLQQAVQRRRRDRTCGASRRARAVGRNVTSAGSAISGGGQRAGQDVQGVVAADARQVEHFGLTVAAGARRQEVRAIRLAQERGDDVVRASRSVATSTSSAKPGCPRFSSSTSV